jgi:uncharacterized protein YjbJ (UPF0337 family)
MGVVAEEADEAAGWIDFTLDSGVLESECFFPGTPPASLRRRGDAMFNKDEVKGRTETVKGKVKRAVGDVTDDEPLRQEGEADEAAGRVQEGYGRARRKVGEAIEDVGEKVKR